MRQPLEWIGSEKRKPLFIPLLIFTLIIFAVFQPLGKPLINPSAPAGIVSFELARTPEKASAMVASWDSNEHLYAAFGLGFDYLFMVLYATTIALGCLLVGGRHGGVFARLGSWVAWGAFFAAICDAVENISLWNILLGQVQTFWPLVSFCCASIKFSLILLGILYGLIGWLWPKKNPAAVKRSK